MNGIGLWNRDGPWITMVNIRRAEKYLFIAIAILAWLPPTVFAIYLGVTENLFLIALFLTGIFPITILLCVLSILAFRRYHPLMWIVFIPFLTVLYGLDRWGFSS